MKKAMKFSFLTVLLVAIVLAAPAQNQPQKKISYDKIVGKWALEANAGGGSYSLILDLKLAAGKLEGGLSEQNGGFTNAQLSNIAFDGQLLKFEVKVPTPPDGAERLAKSELKLVDNNLIGTMVVEELGMSATVTGTKK